MNRIKKIYCRVFQFFFRAALPVLPYRKPEILTDMEELGRVLKEQGKEHVLIVTDKGISSLGLLGIPETIEGIIEEDIPRMAAHADKESNPLYPVPRLMDARELAGMYWKIAGKRKPADMVSHKRNLLCHLL